MKTTTGKKYWFADSDSSYSFVYLMQKGALLHFEQKGVASVARFPF